MPKAFDLGNPRIMTSREALEVPDVPADLLIVGGGYIGMELGTVYATLGSKVVVVEALASILMGADPDLVRPVQRYAEKAFKEVRVNTKVLSMATAGKQIKVVMEKDWQEDRGTLRPRAGVGWTRAESTPILGLENRRSKGRPADSSKSTRISRRTCPAIYAIGDVAGGVLLAHKAAREARVAVDAILGEYNAVNQYIIPAVVFTDPEVAWCGLTESEAKGKGSTLKVANFPWAPRDAR